MVAFLHFVCYEGVHTHVMLNLENASLETVT